MISATGFKVDMKRLGWIGPSITERLKCEGVSPALSANFETSVPGLFMIGIAAANSFGPLLRFAYGAGFAANRVSRYLVRTASPQRATVIDKELVAA